MTLACSLIGGAVWVAENPLASNTSGYFAIVVAVALDTAPHGAVNSRFMMLVEDVHGVLHQVSIDRVIVKDRPACEPDKDPDKDPES